ncbi:hypothetical protein CF138_04525 [Aeromonas hydrophila]|uniref:hypothetical protein n=1 Tax=Aeromonas hydrophila TaxID=644 RepID=UPI001115E303|nr:hypothetical protein [Aeromonas hydrophila]TNH89130.1 hypothetical protein CF138_04525 [Aeromonas hydrophila]TNI00972.1 hypothetical protein CF136_08790 [Aeromonas hydrophila]TNI97976.1 hypothetical protein CF118_05875 [Aeromonas hydrophila]
MNTAQVIELVQQPSAKDKALAEMRGLFGRNGAASRWSRLPTRARAVICYAAGLSTTYGGRELAQFDIEQQEALRLALGELLATLHEFDGGVLDRREWHRPTGRNVPTGSEREQAEHQIKQRALLNEKASTLEGRIAALRRAARNDQ